jgi:hypothetical protein
MNQVLIALTSTELQQHFRNTFNISEKFENLFRAKYPQSDAIHYYTQLTNLRQNDFLTIQEYHEEIMHTCERLAICKSWDQTTLQNRAEEVFYNGLTKRTQLEMSRLNIQTPSEMFKLILTTEKTMIEQMKNLKFKNRPRKESRNDYRETNKREVPTETYCSFHN